MKISEMTKNKYRKAFNLLWKNLNLEWSLDIKRERGSLIEKISKEMES